MRNFLAPVIIVLLVILYSSVFIVEEGTRSLLLRFGQVERNSEGRAVIYSPGLHFKLPLIETIKVIDAKIQTIDNQSDRFTTSENKDLNVDSYLKWQVADFEQYYVATSGGNLSRAQTLLKSRLDNNLRAAIGCKTISEIVIDSRGDLMTNVHNALNGVMIKKPADRELNKCELDMNTTASSSNIAGLGINIVDLRIKQMNLPDEVSQDIYKRMREGRKVVAQLHRSQGESEARKNRANADYEVTVTLANAEREARILRGEGDATVAKLFADAFGQEPDFYSFIRSLKAYENSFKENRDVIVVSPQQNEFFNFMGKPSEHLPVQSGQASGQPSSQPTAAPEMAVEPETAVGQ